MRSSLFTIILLVFIAGLSHGQNLDGLSTKDPVKLRGSLAVGTSLYQAQDIANRRSPLAYYLTASPTVTLFGLDIPMSFTYRDQQGSLSNPFNRFTINPTYKWVKLYFGNNSLQLSPYTLSGQIMNGYGVELTPGKFRFTAAYGTLENPLTQIDTLVEGANLLPSYRRESMALKIGFGSSSNYIDIIGFRAKDDINSSNLEFINTLLVKPEENIVVGTSLGLSPISFMVIKANIAASAITSNQNSVADLELAGSPELLQDVEEFFTLNLSSKLQFAGDAGIQFKFKRIGFGLQYKRVDPLYKSLGTFYFQEDYENYTFKLNFTALKGKIRFNGRGGIQRNNLNNLRNYTRTRNIVNVNLNVLPSRSFSTSMRFANFQSDRTPGLINVNDTTRFAQTTTSYGIVPRLTFGDRSMKSTIQVSINYQELIDVGFLNEIGRSIDNYTGVLNYTLQFPYKDLSFSASGTGNRNVIEGRETQRLGGNLGVSKSLFSKSLRLNLSIGYLENTINNVFDGTSKTARLGINYKKSRYYSLSSNFNLLVRDSNTASSFQEFRGTIRYAYLFNTHKN